MSFSARSCFDLDENDLAKALREVQAKREVLDLTEANPTRVGFAAAAADLTRALAVPANVHYAPDALGLVQARQVLAADLARRGHPIGAEQLVLSASTSEAYTYLFKLLCDPGDEVLIPAPSYPLFDYLAQLESVVPVSYPLGFEGTFFYDVDEVARRITPRTRAIIIVSPNNPTGTYLREDTLDALLDLQLPIVSDEVFERYALGRPPQAVSASAATRGLTFSLFGLSKQAALPQLKLAWTAVAGERKNVAAALARLELIGDSLLSVGTPVMNGVAELLAIGDQLREQVLARARQNVRAARANLAGTSVTPLHTEGGIYLVLRIPDIAEDMTTAIALLRSQGVHVHPGTFFGFSRGAHFVVSLLTEEGTFFEGMGRIRAFFDANLPAA